MGAPSDIERLVELGLNRFGAGDLDGAILMWEEALAIDAAHERATGYLEYVKANYDLLANAEPALATGDDAFAIEEEPEYHIQVTPGELAAGESATAADELDSGWFEGDTASDVQAGEPLLDLEADTGTGELTLAPYLAPTVEAREPEPEEETDSGSEINFEDATREYHNARKAGQLPLMPPKPSDFAEAATGEFHHDDETTGGFRSDVTEVRKRDLGFVQPVEDKAEATGERTFERGAFSFEGTEDDLLATKPRLKRPVDYSPQAQANIETQDLPLVGEKTTKREMPEPRPPARRDSAELSQAEVMMTAKSRLEIDMGAPTRDLGLRPEKLPAPPFEELPTKQSDVRAIREAKVTFEERPETRQDIVLAFDPINARSEQILAEIDDGVPENEAIDEQTRRRIGALIERALEWSRAGDVDRAVTAVDLAMQEDPNSVLAQKLITRNRDSIMTIFQSFVGDMERQPQLAKPLHELQNAPISPRAAFLLSRVDGTLTVDELLDVSGMPRMEAYRYLCQLLLRGILR